VGCHLGWHLATGLISVRGNRGENYENEPLVPQKHIKKKKIISTTSNFKIFATGQLLLLFNRDIPNAAVCSIAAC
jgi:hypothetical protein